MSEKNTQVQKNEIKSNDYLKLIALVTMFIDHLGYFIFTDISLFRTIGRISFPIFTYYLALGYDRTSNIKRYALRILKFAFITHFLYSLTLYSFKTKEFYYNPLQFNVMFLLFFGIGVIYIYNKFREKFEDFKKEKTFFNLFMILFYFFILVLALLSPDLFKIYIGRINFSGLGYAKLKISYDSYGLFLILIFYIYKENPIKAIVSFIFLSIFDAHLVFSSKAFYTNIDRVFSFERVYLALNEIFIKPFLILGDKTELINSLNRHVSSIMYLKYPYFQSRAILGLFIIYVMRGTESKLRLHRNFVYWFYPLHVIFIGAISYLIDILS